MSDAKRATAPCGHPGEHVIGNYVRCLTKGCDGTPRRGRPAPAKPDDFKDKPTLPLWFGVPAPGSGAWMWNPDKGQWEPLD